MEDGDLIYEKNSMIPRQSLKTLMTNQFIVIGLGLILINF